MKIIHAGFEILGEPDGPEILKRIELAGRVCYKSEDRITDTSAERFVRGLIQRGHESVLEHEKLTVRFIVDRGVMAELTRHRLASFSVESSRFCNYSKDRFGREITVIKPLYLEEGTPSYDRWKDACEVAESAYFDMLEFGCTPQEARAVLPNSLKTEVVMTGNLREWKTVLRLRASKESHPQMREVMTPLLIALRKEIPCVFDDVYKEVFGEGSY